MIKLINVIKRYQGANAVNDITLTIPSGKIFGIIGKSGAGKSTLVRLMSLLERPDSGEIYFDNVRVDNLSDNSLITHRMELGMIFQNFNLFTSRDVLNNVCYPLELAGMSKVKRIERGLELLELVGIRDKAYTPVSKLSGGQKQRVAIARALANNPKILFCDEATSALDPKTTKSILKLIKDIQSKINLTVIMITHQMDVVKDICDNVAIIADGKIVETGTVRDIFKYSENKITIDFISDLQPDESSIVLDENNITKIYKLHFRGGNANKPIVYQLVKKFDLEINILLGSILVVDNEPIGELVIGMNGEEQSIIDACEWLQANEVATEHYFY